MKKTIYFNIIFSFFLNLFWFSESWLLVNNWNLQTRTWRKARG